MTAAAFLLLTMVMVVAAGNWLAVARDNKVLEYVCKPLTMVLLIATALALDVDNTGVQTWFVIALVACLVGDVFLMLPSDRFVLGLAAFLLGHIAYVVGMLVDGVVFARVGMGLVVVAVAVVAVGLPIFSAVRRGTEPELTGPVVAYMAVISAMVVTAIGTGHVLAVAGAVSFYASDALIAWNRFRSETPHPRVSIMVTYHLAQVGLVLSLVS